MTPKRWLRGAVVLFVAAAAACQDNPVTPSNPVPPRLPSQPNLPPPFPAVPNGTLIYAGSEDLYEFISGYHRSKVPTRYVLFADSTFQLQFASYRFGIFQYGGRYSRTDSGFIFNWEGWSVLGDWGGGAFLRGDTLDVRYNEVMHWSDFVDGRYILVR